MIIRALFVVEEVLQGALQLKAVLPPNTDKPVTPYTANGSFLLEIANPDALATFAEGQEYYIDVTQVDEIPA